jgi:hypothetical protein
MTSYLRFDRWQNTAGTQYSNVIQTIGVTFSQTTTISVDKSYQPLSGGSITITSSFANTKFLLMGQAQGYHAANGGANIGFNRVLGGVTTRLLGVDGNQGESWMAEGNGTTTNSFNIIRHWLDSPGQAAGATITYNLLGGNWGAANGTVVFNYSGYSPNSTFTVMEIQP